MRCVVEAARERCGDGAACVLTLPGYPEGMEPLLDCTRHAPSPSAFHVHWIADRLAAGRDSGRLKSDMRHGIRRYWEWPQTDPVEVVCSSNGKRELFYICLHGSEDLLSSLSSV